jgi:hypothetical protein
MAYFYPLPAMYAQFIVSHDCGLFGHFLSFFYLFGHITHLIKQCRMSEHITCVYSSCFIKMVKLDTDEN